MFQLDDDFDASSLAKLTGEMEGNYLLKANDALLLDVFTNEGERLVDPNLELVTGPNQQQQQFKDRFNYVIQADGTVAFPIIGEMNLAGMTQFTAEEEIAKRFDAVYKDSFVKLRIVNRRVFVLGAPGGRVIPIPNENTTLIEVLASSEGISAQAKAHNIKLIRGDDVFQIDLGTVSGMKSTHMLVAPGDVIYVEPWKRPFLETMRDISPTLSLVTSILTLIVVFQNL